MIINSWKCSCGYNNSILGANLTIPQEAKLSIPKGMFIPRKFEIVTVQVECQNPNCNVTNNVGVKN